MYVVKSANKFILKRLRTNAICIKVFIEVIIEVISHQSSSYISQITSFDNHRECITNQDAQYAQTGL